MKTATKKQVLVIATRIANVASVAAGLRRVGAVPVLTNDPEQVRAAELVVLPGVGSFAKGMNELVRTGIDQVIAERVEQDRPTLAICLGMQMLFEGSEEAPSVTGLGLLPGRALRFSSAVRVPQLGWNDVVPEDGCRWLGAGAAYFANSYRVITPPSGWRSATSEHGGRFVAAVERGAVVACQFHPELSGSYGTSILERWVLGREVLPC